MPFYNDERLRRIRVGIDSYTNNELALDVIGNTNIFADGGLGINTTNTEGIELYVNGDGFFSGVVTARTFFAGPTEITGGAFADDLTVTTLKVNGISTLGGNSIGAGETSVFIKQNANVEADLYVGDELYVETAVGIGTTNPEQIALYVDGDGYFTGVVTATTFFAGPTEITGGAFADDLTVNTLEVTGVTTIGTGFTVGVGTTSIFIKKSANVEDNLYVGADLYVAGLSTFVGVSSFKSDVTIEGDLYINQVVGTGGTIAFTDTANNVLGDVDTGAVQIDGGLGVAKNTSIGQSLWVGGNIGVGSTQPTARLDVVGLTELDELNVSGLSTFASDVDINASADISGDLVIQNDLDVTGLSTFGSDLDVNASVDISTNLTVDGLSDLDELNVAGLSTFASDLDINSSVDISTNLTVDGLSDLDELNVSGVSTFTDTTDNTLGNVDTGAVQIDGGLGVAKNVSIGGSFYVQGQSEFIGVVTFRGGTINIGDQDSDDINVGGEFVSSLVPNDDDTYDLGSPTKEWRNLYVDGLAEIDDLNVSGLSTFGSNVDINASVDILNDLTVDGLSDLDELNVAGIATFGSDVDVNSSIDVSNNLTVDGLSDLDELNVAGIATFGSDLDVNASVDISTNLTVDGLSDLDELNVAGLSTFGSNVDVNASVDISTNLTVDGLSDLDELNVAGIATFGSDLDVNASVDISTNLTVDGLSDLDELNVAGLSTFASDLDVNASVDISGDLVIQDALNVTGLSTFGDNVDVNASVDISQTLNVTGVATFGNNVEITGDLTVNGNQTILNTQILEVEDINIGIASADPKLSDASLDGAGITIHGAAGDKTLTWSNADSRMEFNTTLYTPKLETDLLDVTGVSTFGGNVDINADLDVSGDAVIAGILTVGSASVVIDGDNNSITVGTGASIYTPLDNILTFGTLDLERVRIDDGGNVGIGTTNAVGIADTNNTTILNAGIVTANFFFGSGAGLFDIFADAKGPDGAIQYNNETNIDGATNFFYNDTTNRVGIGTSLPTTDFEVDGNINVTGLSTFNNIDVTGVSTFQSNLIVDSNLGVGTDNPVGLADTNNTSIINTGIVTANFFFGSGAGLFDIFADAKGEDGAIQYNNATNIDGAADFFYDDVNLRVGIGSTVPTVKLDVDGDTNITGIVTAQEFVGIGSQLTNITFRQLSDVDGSNLVAGPGISSTPDYLVIYDPLLDAFRFVDPKSYFGINNDFNPDPIIVDYGSY